MRPFAVAHAGAALAAVLLASAPARASEPDAGLAVVVGAATIFAGFTVGGTMIASSADPRVQEAGWFAIESGFTLAPLGAHGVVGEWGRGAIFAAVPTATTLSTIPVFLEKPDAVDHGSLEEQRVMWGLFVGGLGVAVAGVIDAAFAPGRAVHVAPMLGAGTTGLVVGGAL